jgi:hypothetical protein
MDEELKAISRILKVLDALPSLGARRRALSFVESRLLDSLESAMAFAEQVEETQP